MKYLKMLGLVSTAAVMTLGVSASASGTVLCKQAQTTGSTTILESLSGVMLNTCPEATTKITTSNAGSATETVKGSVASLTWSICVYPQLTLKAGETEIHHVTSGTPTFTTKSTEFT